MIKVIKQINERQILIEQDGKNFLVSESIPDLVPQETLVFSCDSEGKVSDWVEVGGEVGYGLDTYMKILLESGSILAPWKYEDDIPW